jgi:hypothetical protein
LSSRLLSKNIKIRIYRTIILPVVLYGCETWSLTLREEHRMRVFENRVLRRIFDSASNINEYQEFSWGIMSGRSVRLTTSYCEKTVVTCRQTCYISTYYIFHYFVENVKGNVMKNVTNTG